MASTPYIPWSHHVSRSYLENKVKEQPRNGRLHKTLAPLKEEIRDGKAALRHYRAATELSSGDADAANDFGLALFKIGRWDEAVKEMKRGLRIQPYHILLHKNLAAVYARRGRYREALDHAKEAVRIAPWDPQAHRSLAKILDATGNTRDSLSHNRQAVLTGPGMQAAREHHDAQAYRRVAIQTVARGQTQRGHASAYYDAHRALAGKKFDMPTTEITKQLLFKTRTTPELT
uniref:Tetratricopeptide repeat protein n=1 Tax=Rhizochromulina marina TaxID=1034831 RepID=A0A7S2RJZ9_9STRA|mmetsp:Transcript_17433/g.50928  ORF Transcript_17433/g.50928 Transcript_17433/m.50928 type:complete len:232 (+) Transcript_17433:179-874(+)